MIPHYLNPHSLDVSLEPTSRALLDDNSYSFSGDSGGREVNDMLLTKLEQTLKRSIGDVDSALSGDAHTRKRRRTDEINLELPEAVESMPFRLISRSLPPKALVLHIDPPPVINVKEPPCEDDEQEADLRHRQAQAVAVDMDWLLKESKKPHLSSRVDDKKVTRLVSSVPLPDPSLMIIERPKPAQKPPRLALSVPSEQVLPSPHELSYGDIRCPVIEAQPPSQSASETLHVDRRRRRKSRSVQARPRAMFWRPLREWGAGAYGYAMGYEGSWPIFADDPERFKYQRDTMRKGVMWR